MNVKTIMLGFFLGLTCAVSLLPNTVLLAEEKLDKTTASTKPIEKALQVTVLPLSDLLSKTVSSAPATVISLNHATLSAEITGRITAIDVEAGETVQKGKRLASIDCRSYALAQKQAQAALKVAKTQFNLAKKQFIRNQKLVQQGTIPRALFDEADANQRTTLADIELKNVQIESSKLAVSRCQIIAPFTGQITQRFVQQGQLVTPATPLFKLLQTNALEVKANLSPAEIKPLTQSSKLSFVTDTQSYPVKIRHIIQTVDETTRTQEVRLRISNNLKAATGLSGRIEWLSNNAQLSPDYLLRRGDHLGVMLAVVNRKTTQFRAKFHPLPDAKEGQAATIKLSRKTKIINLNRYRVKDGQLIGIIDNEKDRKNSKNGKDSNKPSAKITDAIDLSDVDKAYSAQVNKSQK